jgi:hypothetical protein
MQKNASLRLRRVKNFASAGIKPKSVYRFVTTGCKVTVAELIARRSWTGLKYLVPGFLDRKQGSVPGRLTRLKNPIL